MYVVQITSTVNHHPDERGRGCERVVDPIRRPRLHQQKTTTKTNRFIGYTFYPLCVDNGLLVRLLLSFSLFFVLLPNNLSFINHDEYKSYHFAQDWLCQGAIGVEW